MIWLVLRNLFYFAAAIAWVIQNALLWRDRRRARVMVEKASGLFSESVRWNQRCAEEYCEAERICREFRKANRDHEI